MVYYEACPIGYGMGYGMFGMGWWIPGLLIGGLIIAGAVYLLSRSMQPMSGPRRGMSSEEILKQRYAKGELSPKEYSDMLKELQK